MRNYWQDQLYQTRFAIAEQKANLHYTREPNAVAGDRYMVDFYKHWSQTLPRASAAWRDMMTSAARFAKAARAAGASGAASARAAALKSAVQSIEQNRIQPAYATMQALYDFAVSRAGMAPGSGSDLLNAFDFTATQLGGQAPQSGVGGAPTFTQILDAAMSSSDWPTLQGSIKKYAGAGWDGVLNHQHVLGMLEGLRRGRLREAQLYANYGDTATARNLRSDASKIAASMSHFRSIFSGDFAQYTTLHDTFHASLQGSNSPYETVALAGQYSADLLKLATKAEARGDFTLAGQLRLEANAANGQTPGGSATIGESTQGGQVTNKATDVNATSPTTTQADANKLTGGVVGALTETGQPQTEAQALAFAMQTAQYEAQGLSDGSLVMTVDANNSMQIVPRATMQGIGKGNPVITVGVPTAGATYTDAKGKTVQLPGTVLQQAITLMPVYVTVPSDPTNPDTQLAPGPNTTDLKTSLDANGNQLQSRFAGYRVDYGNGKIGYAHPTGTVGPDGQPELVYSAVPPYVNSPGAIHSEGVQADGTYRVEYSVFWLDQQAKDGALGAVLAPVFKTDAKGNQVLDLKGTPITTGYTFNPSGVVSGRVSTNGQYLFGATAPQLTPAPLGSVTQTTPTTPATAPTPDTTTINQSPTPGQPAPGASQSQWDQHLTDLWTQSHPDGEAPPPKDSPVWGSFAAANGLPVTAPSVAAPAATPTPPVTLGPLTVTGGIGQQPPPPPAVLPATYQGGGRPQDLGITPAQTAIAQQANQQAINDAFNAAYYATISTHPNFLGWGNGTLFNAAWSEQSRRDFAALPPDEIIKTMQRDDPLWNNPGHQSAILGQIDVMRGSGLSGQTEGQFAIQRAFTSGSLGDLLGGASALVHSAQTPSIFTALGSDPRTPILSPDPHRDPFAAPVSPYQQPVTKLPTAPTLAIVPSIPNPRTGASQAAHQLGTGDIYQVNPRTPSAVTPTTPQVASLPATARVTPTTVNPLPAPKIKTPAVPPPPPPPPPPVFNPDGGTHLVGRGKYEL